ncbi:glycosyltransferase family 4 protein [Paenisporosarcina indica]|uniref:glycosyltransferase family 4 protein n=1 Tax=Paenisporosarcina indica TaxID=650093 RepID=UPI00094FE5D4|nr:glycosyltransferase family 4 protein [Paenisporosarcina indica]
MSNQVKILQVCAIDLSVEALLKPLIERSMVEGYTVHNVCTNLGRFEELKSQGLNMINISIDRKIHPLKNAKSIWKLFKLMKKEQYDIVHVHTPIAALLGRIAAKLAGVKHVVYTAHGFYFHDEMSKKQYKLFYSLEKYAARYLTDWLFLQSKEDYELAVNDKFKFPKRIIHLSNGVDIWMKFNNTLVPSNDIAEFYSNENINEKDFVFSFTGRLVKEKGIFELIESFKRLNIKYPHAKLILIGGLPEGERDLESYQKLISDIKHESIRYLGFRKDIPLLMNASDVYILPSYREGLPRSIIEAMAMEKPVIATNIRGCREEVFDGENGYLVEKENVQELYEAMEKLISNPTLVKQFGMKSREIVEELFDEEKVLSKQIELFNTLTR